MRLSTSTCMYFNRPDGTKCDLNKSIIALNNAGYKVLDMNFHDALVFKTAFVSDAWISWIDSIKETASRLGVEFSQSHAHFYNYCLDSSDNEYLEMLVKRSIISSEKLGIPWVTIHAATDFDSDAPYKNSKKKSLEYFKRLSDFAADHNTGIAIENLWELNISPQRRYTSNPEELIELVELLDRDNVGICWDIEHSLIMNQNILKTAKMFEPWLKNTHISDYVHTHFDHILPYQGLGDWEDVINAFAAMDKFAGDFTYEVHRFTMRLPDYAIESALKYSYELGLAILQEIERRKRDVIR